MSTIRKASMTVFVLGLALVLCGSRARAGEEASQAAVDKAHNFMKTAARGKSVNEMLHFGTKYSGHEYVKTLPVKNASGQLLPGQFALVYRYWWDEKYSTDLAVLCSASGSVESVQVLRTDGVLQEPFVAAQATITLIGNLLLEAFKDQMEENDRRTLRQIVDRADAKGLLEMQLRLQQAFGR